MKKSYKLFLACLLCAIGAMNVYADERVPLTQDMFFAWDGWGADAQKTGPADCTYVIGESTGQPYGDSQVINYADLSLYSKLIVVCTEGTPRFLFNRDIDEGQWNENEAESHLIDNTRNGWSAKYFSQDGETYIVDLKQMVKDKGFAHLHSIKGANWANVTVTSMELVREGKAQVVGWTDLITNGDLEGDDVSCFYSKENGSSPYPSVITDGVGVDGSRGIQVHSAAGAAQDWDAQFWINLPETLPEGTKYRVSFAYRASMAASADTQAHRDPSDYIHYEMIGSPNFTTDWQTYNVEGTLTAQQSGEGTMHSIAFNLSKDRANDVDFFFDNIKFEVYKYGTVAEFSEDVIELDFGFDTNIGELVKATGKRRLMYPDNCVTVKVNGKTMPVYSVEGFDDGRFYIFLDEGVNDDDLVEISFVNPTDPAYHLTYTSGPGGDVPNFSGQANNNYEIQYNPKDDVYPYQYLTPVIVEAEPEDGSFNLPNSIKEFTVKFDKATDAAVLEAYLNNEKLQISPAEGFAEDFTLTRTSAGDLATDAYELRITKIYPEMRLDDSIYGDSIYTINVGKVNADPTDVPADLLPDYFAAAGSGTIPEGWYVMFGQEERPSQTSYGSGSRMFDFASGGDFTKGLYFREGYAEYGSTVGYPLTLTGGKRYTISFTTAMWKDNGNKTRFEIFNPAGEVVFVQVVDNSPNVNGGTGAVNGASKHSFKFTPDESGDYIIRWTSSSSDSGDPAYMEIILANPQVKYIPNIAGVEETQLLNNALAEAKSTRDGNTAERYAGAAFNALNDAINKYEAEAPNYTSPSAYKNAAAVLEAVSKAMKDHRTYCDNYDEQIKKSIDVVRDYAGTKFDVTELYGDLKEINKKYNAYSEWIADPEFEGEGEFAYFYDVLTDDAALVEAANELSNAVKVAGYMFTEGESKTSSDVGIKVLVDRIRQGAEGLKQLGVAEEDELIVRADKAVTDDDELAELMKNRIRVEFYGKMKDGIDMFPETVDENTLETVTPTYNFTVFVKNPNTYAWKESAGVTEENCPGWTMVEGNAGLTNMWNGGYAGDIDGLPKDLCITQYHQTNRIEQTITDLPAGVYNVMIDCAEWSDEFTPGESDDDETIATKEANHEMNRVYVKTSDTPVYEDGQIDPEQFAADARIDHYGQYVGRHENVLENVVVTDGILTIGVKWNNLAQFMFDRVQLFLANPAAAFDYASAYNEAITSIDDAVAPAKVRAIELFDLNGRRIMKAGKGMFIMKKHMSDGSVVTEKVIKK